MPIRYSYDAAADLVRVESFGHVTSDDIRGYYEGLAAEPWMRPGMRFLADNRALTDVPPAGELGTAVLAAVRRAFFLTGARVAVLVANPFQYGTTRQFAAFSADAGAQIEPFYDVDEALRWLSAGDDAPGGPS